MPGATIIPRLPVGFVDTFSDDILARKEMISAICDVYARHGFEALETPAVEYLDTLGKYLPESDEPQGGVFAFKDDDGQWLSLRYDLTAPLSRVVAQHGSDLPSPFRRYQVGPVWRREKPGPGRFRQFYQCDFDTVGSSSPAADAEVCVVLAAAFGALGIRSSDFQIRVNNRKVLSGVLEAIGISADDPRQLVVLRAVDKLDRLGLSGVRELLGKERRDDSGDVTPGADLSTSQTQVVLDFVQAAVGAADRRVVCQRLHSLVGTSDVGRRGVDELEQIDSLLTASHLDPSIVSFDPTVVRGLAYYTGPVFEAVLTAEIVDNAGVRRSFGSVAGGGRYDDLVRRFSGKDVPATGASIGVDRLLTALKVLKKADAKIASGPVVVTVMDRTRLHDYQAMVAELRSAGIAAELYLGEGGFRVQMKYADRRQSPAVIIAGEDEFQRGEVSIKNMRLGAELSRDIKDRAAWLKAHPAQQSVPRATLVEQIRAIVAS